MVSDNDDDEFDWEQEFTESEGPILAGVEVPAPVFFCSIEAESTMTQTALDKALVVLQREDPSFKVIVLNLPSKVKSVKSCKLFVTCNCEWCIKVL